LLQRYNADTERWKRRHAGCVNQARNWKGQYRHFQTQLQNTQNQLQNAQNLINNLNLQISALQNNPPRVGMAGYAPLSFSRSYDKDISFFINKFKRYLIASGNALANNADQISALSFFKSCLKGKAAEWLEREIVRKNWELSYNLTTVNVNLVGLQAVATAAIVPYLSTIAIYETKIKSPKSKYFSLKAQSQN
jgi:hypothetical protein